jgi:hypothetical protein
MNNRILGLALLAALGATTMQPAPAQQAQGKYTSTIGTVELNAESSYQDLPKLDASQKLATHRYTLLLPKGASLHPVPDEEGQVFLHAEILVKDAKGQVIGTVDSAWAQDANGESLATFFMIEGNTLIQTVDTSNAAEKTATAVLMYAGATAPSIDAARGWQQTKAYVGIPSNYRYGSQYTPRSLHDYCTSSPDEFPNPVGANANFRGPCARHDMCYEAHTAGKTTCDNNLWSHMVSNCQYTYAWYNPVRQTCINTAHVYWIAVKSFGGY